MRRCYDCKNCRREATIARCSRRKEVHKNNQDLAKLNKEANTEKLMSFVEKSQKRSVPVAKNAKAPEASDGNTPICIYGQSWAW